jgi:hypothetical protein
LEYPVSPQMRQAVDQYISKWLEVEIITQGRISVEPEAGITIILMSGKSLPPEFEAGLTKAVQKARGGEPVVRIYPVLAARQQAPEQQGIRK